jgi:hypothetical protein
MNNQRPPPSRKRTEQPPPVPQKPAPVQNSVAVKKTTTNVRAGQSRQGMSVSDAIGMTTVRLCRVEQLLNLQGNKNAGAPSEKGSVDVSVLGSIVERLGRMEQSYDEPDKTLEFGNTLVILRDEIAQIMERLAVLEAKPPDEQLEA